MHPVTVITGASGGLGTSTLAAVTATVLARDGPSVLVDAAFGSGGLDATTATEHVEGLRWGDLAQHEGRVDALGLRRELPVGPVPVLAARGPRPSVETVREVVRGLAGHGPVVVDVPAGTSVPRSWQELADVLVVLVGLRPRWLRDGEAVAAACRDVRDRTLLVTRGPRRAQQVSTRAADHLDLTLLDHLADDPGVLRDEARGRAPRPRGPVGEVARAVAGTLPGESAPAAVLGVAS